MKINIECNEEQAQLMLTALEVTFRMMMGQPQGLTELLAQDTPWHDKENPMQFEKYLVRRNALENILKSACIIAYGIYQERTSDNCRSICDIFSVLRYEIHESTTGENDEWYTRETKPIQLGAYDLPKISVEVDKNE